ncbi:hypothetical protein JHK82_027602 [Glycine max]|nr:hypothetical protein JHK85_028248 [Glycine max]KAG5003590.1 hypothetical protein JHK86_027729 [Glycine max]KAG5126767.1 hypothetical protein JHK82_027602 [Glycine max]KAG5151377.1 hypothetical protein JHK84_027849 [Glycine max]
MGTWKDAKSLELLSKTGCLDLSDWVSSGFKGKALKLTEHIDNVEIRKSEMSGRGSGSLDGSKGTNQGP